LRFHTHLLPTYFPETDPPFGRYLRNVIEQVTLAEELGWECQWFTEHHFLQYGGPIPNPAVMLAAVAARTSRIRLGSAIAILPLHHPIQVAEDYAMVDAISGGRLEFGIGRGNTELDYRVYGVDPEERRGRLEEAIELIRSAWAQERFSHHGRFWQVDDCTLTPRPEQSGEGGPPIWLAATSTDSVRWAGRQGFHLMTVSHPFPPERVDPIVAAWRDGLQESGRDPSRFHIKLHVRVYVHADRARAREVAEAAIIRYETVYQTGRTGSTKPFSHETYDWEGMLAQGRNIYGNPEDCMRLIQTAAKHFDFDICSTTFNFGGIPYEDVLESMRLFSKEVMPAFAEAPEPAAQIGTRQA
jgi:alkanesulfonate monooxygenase SsuD/methylene tetrahydromethanopterin reductase-like flavin-dependent oxidoreductase (luciferase family)